MMGAEGWGGLACWSFGVFWVTAVAVAIAIRRVKIDRWRRLRAQHAARQWALPATKSPLPIEERIAGAKRARVISGDETAVAKKSMPFWCVDKDFAKSSPKSERTIRRLLMNIRHWVRKSLGTPQ